MKTGLFGPAVEFQRYADGSVVFKLRDLVEALALEWTGQWKKVSSDPLDRYRVVDERFFAEDGKEYMSKGIRAEYVQNFLDDININRVSKEAVGRILNLRDYLRGENLAELALRHIL